MRTYWYHPKDNGWLEHILVYENNRQIGCWLNDYRFNSHKEEGFKYIKIGDNDKPWKHPDDSRIISEDEVNQIMFLKNL